VKDPAAFSQRMRKEIRRRLIDAERVAWQREAMLARLRARAAERREPMRFYIGDADDDDLSEPEVGLCGAAGGVN